MLGPYFTKLRGQFDWEKYRQLRNMSKTMTRNAKSDYHNKCLAQGFKNPKQFWHKLKNFITLSDKFSPTNLKIN